MIGFGRLRAIGLAIGGALALGGCGYGGTSYGVSLGYGGYGGYDGYYDGWGDPYGWGGNGYGYGYPSYGWYNGFYYPGSGVYVLDRGGRRYRWNDAQRRYWEGRRGGRPGDGRPGGWQQGQRPDRPGGWQQGQRPDRPNGWQSGRGDGRPGGWRGNRPGQVDGQATVTPQPATPGVTQPAQRGWRGAQGTQPQGQGVQRGWRGSGEARSWSPRASQGGAAVGQRSYGRPQGSGGGRGRRSQ